jgi:hypothetical protein
MIDIRTPLRHRWIRMIASAWWPTWAAAQEACADLAPTPPDGAAPTAGSGT